MSVSEAAGLLKRLGSISAGAASGVRLPPRVGTPGFAELLSQARGGSPPSGGPVEVDASAELATPLSEEQLGRIAEAVDRAEAAGASRALVLVDGRALRVDVLTRRVVEEVDLSGGAPAVDVDAVVEAAGGEEPETLGPPRAAAPAFLDGVFGSDAEEAR